MRQPAARWRRPGGWRSWLTQTSRPRRQQTSPTRDRAIAQELEIEGGVPSGKGGVHQVRTDDPSCPAWVKVDFAPDMDWTEEHVRSYAAFVSRRVRQAGLKHFDRGAVARVVEHGARLRDHQRSSRPACWRSAIW